MARHVLGMIGPARKGKDLALAQVVFENLRNRILDGLWRHGEKLPGTRVIAKDAGVSRWTAVMAVDMLLAEGLVEARKRSGTYVNWSGNGPELRPDVTGPGNASDGPKAHVPFAIGVPGLDLFPMHVWRRMQSKRWKEMPVDALQTGHDGGWPELRTAIAAHVGATRGLKCTPAQVFVTTSAHAAVLLASEVLCRPGSVVWMEEPGYFRTRSALQTAGFAPVAVAVDGQGINVDDGRRQAPKASMAVVTGAFQFPTGVALSERRKHELLEWSAQVGSFILEDDFACEFRHPRTTSPPLSAMPNARAVYMNTFSTTIFPSLRLSYLIVPRAIADRFAEALRRTERYATVPNQIVLADFLASGQFAKHIRRCREAYAERHQTLALALQTECHGMFVGDPLPSGMHLGVRFKERIDDVAVTSALRDAGLGVEPFSRFYAGPTTDSGLLLGFAGFRPEMLREATKRFAAVVANFIATTDRAAAGA